MNTLSSTLKNIGTLDRNTMDRAQVRLDMLTKPRGSLGMLEDTARRIAGITKSLNPSLAHKVIFTVAADHGVTAEGVSLYPSEVTAQMVMNFLNGGAGINVLSRHVGARVVVVDAGVAADLPSHPELKDCKICRGTRNIVRGPAMTPEEALKSVETGIRLVEEEAARGIDLIGTGDMGIGNTTASSAIVAIVTGTSIEQVTGRGTGITDNGLAQKIAIIKKAIALNRPDPKDGLDILAKVGGLEIGVLAGVFLGGAARRVPVVIDGFISGAAALIAAAIEPKAKDFMIASHCSVELGHKVTLDHLGLAPLLNLNMRLGEGTGAALGMNLMEASVKILNEMATFESAGVSDKNV